MFIYRDGSCILMILLEFSSILEEKEFYSDFELKNEEISNKEREIAYEKDTEDFRIFSEKLWLKFFYKKQNNHGSKDYPIVVSDIKSVDFVTIYENGMIVVSDHIKKDVDCYKLVNDGNAYSDLEVNYIASKNHKEVRCTKIISDFLK